MDIKTAKIAVISIEDVLSPSAIKVWYDYSDIHAQPLSLVKTYLIF